jgi:ABC-type multidrug transport system permease subunit
MKLIDIIWKEISVVKSQKIALLLILLYPFLAIFLLGSSFTGIDVNKLGNINVGVVNNLPYDLNLQDAIGGQQNLSLFDFEDVNSMVSGIKRKDVIVGLKLTAPSENARINVDMYYDNSNLLASGIFIDFAKIMLQRMTVEKTRTKLAEIITAVQGLGGNLEGELARISEFKENLAQADDSINSLEAKLVQLDFDEIEDALVGQRQNIDDFENKNQEFKGELQNFKTSFQEMKGELSSLNASLSNYKTEAALVASQLDSSISQTDSLINALAVERDAAVEPEKTILAQRIQTLQGVRTNMAEGRELISNMQMAINALSDEQSTLNTTVSRADALLLTLDAESQNITTALSGSAGTIEGMNSKLVVFKSAIDEVQTLIDDSRQSKTAIEAKLLASENLLSSFSEQMVAFSDLDPSVLAQPVRFYERKLFKVNPFGILVANVAAIVLILTSVLLTSIIVILERTEKVSLRMKLSPTSKLTFLFGKIIGQLAIAGVEAVIIFGVAMFVFGIDLSANFLTLVLMTMLIALAFISLGLIIANLTKTQATAMLTSLLIIVPMLFMSGAMLPLEFMDSGMQLISSLMPLTIANNIFIGVIIKGLSIFELYKEIAVLAMLIILVVLFVMLKEEF